MKLHKRRYSAAAAALLATAVAGAVAQAQSSDALIDKLVDKGILTVKEANDLRQEADPGFTQAYQVKSGMPNGVSSLKFNGDFRGRMEGFYASHPGWTDRTRYRYRLRFGITATLLDDFEVGMRLGSGELNTASAAEGIDPISNNQTLMGNGSKKGIFIDMAYAKWSPLHDKTWTGSLTIGKMENPFVFSDMVFDKDYTPEGAAWQMSYAINDQQALKFNSAFFVLNELAASSYDPYMVGAQLRWDSTWNKRWSSSFGVAALDIANDQFLTSGAVPNKNRGNSRTAAGAPAQGFNPLIADGALTYTRESFPMYPGAFPITLAGEYINNPAAHSDYFNVPGAGAQNSAYNAGITFGKSGKKGAWDISYKYKYLEGNAWYEEMVDSDYGAYYQAAPLGGGAGYGSGTNIKGHVIKASYSPYDSLTLSVTAFVSQLIKTSPTGSGSDMTRLQVDASWKF